LFTHLLVPVDLSQSDDLKKAIQVAADQAKLYNARVTLVSVVGGLQAKVSNSSGKYARKLADFAEGVGDLHGIKFESIVYEVPDPSVEVDGTVLKVVKEIGADLIVMASHQPGWAEYLVNSHGGRVASHAQVSVFVVRDGS
jgi:nucleotide-binding universal stress UspA family protein